MVLVSRYFDFIRIEVRHFMLCLIAMTIKGKKEGKKYIVFFVWFTYKYKRKERGGGFHVRTRFFLIWKERSIENVNLN